MNEAVQSWLEALLSSEGAAAGSVHVQRGTELVLIASKNLPPPVVAAVSVVPYGKGMAGAAQARKAPVQTCNLQTDDAGGAIRPGAKAVGAQAAVALPVLDDRGEVRAVVGLAWMHEGEIAAEKERALMSAAAAVPL